MGLLDEKENMHVQISNKRLFIDELSKYKTLYK